MHKKSKRKSVRTENELNKQSKTEIIQEINENIQTEETEDIQQERSKPYLPHIFQYWVNFLSIIDFGPPKLKVLIIAPTILYLLFGKIAVIAWLCLLIVCTPVALVLKLLKPTIERFTTNEEEQMEPDIGTTLKKEDSNGNNMNETEKRMHDLTQKMETLIQMNQKLAMGEKIHQKKEKPYGLIGSIANIIYNVIFFSISIVFLVSMMYGNIPMIPAIILYIIILIVMKLMYYTGMVKIFIYAILAMLCTFLIGLLIMGTQLTILKLLQMGFITK